MDAFSQALLYGLPAFLIIVAVKLVLDHQLKKEIATRNAQIRAEVMKQHFPLKLSAYERAVLFLERISPQQLFLRVPPAGKTAKQYFDELNFTIHSEYEHNITQQIYISPQSWGALVKSKSDIVQLLSSVSQNLPANADGFALANGVLRVLEEQQAFPTFQALAALKTETNSFFQI